MLHMHCVRICATHRLFYVARRFFCIISMNVFTLIPRGVIHVTEAFSPVSALR
jgi:hypothetical protein